MKQKKPIEVNTQGAAISAQTCPECGARISSQAIVDAWMEQPAWSFWGMKGERWAKCEGSRGRYKYRHFAVAVNGRLVHRIAWIRPTREVDAQLQKELL